jgi:hypothetical protein
MSLFIKPRITSWTRLEPRPRTPDFISSLRAELRDPLWLLTRQRRVGEFQGEDTGSPAYVRVTKQHAPFTKWGFKQGLELDGPLQEFDVDAGKPLETQALAEPHTADLATRVELGQIFFDLIDQKVPAASRDKIKKNIRTPAKAPFAELKPEPAPKFDPRDRATSQFLLVVQAGAVDGFGIYDRAKQWKAPGGMFPPDLADPGAEQTALGKALEALIFWVEQTYGALVGETEDPVNWAPRRLEYDLRLKAGDGGQASLTALPDREGLLGWPAFDFAGQGSTPFTAPSHTETLTEIPRHVRFKGMPAPRFWDFESGELSFPDVNVDMVELSKLVLIDIAVMYGIDWFTIPVDLPTGSIARIQSLFVRDVFGVETQVFRADEGTPPTRWSLFTPSQPGAGLADFTVLPPSVGRTVQQGPVLEEVRFARDEAANFVWAIEKVTPTPVGRPRPGHERAAAVEATATTPPPSADITSPLRYEIESKVPVNWIPFLGVRVAPPSAKIELEKAAVARPNPDPLKKVVLVPSTAKILDPDKVSATQFYRLPEEEVPRAGLRVQRVVYRSRWIDGSTHVWIARRKLVGAGETQSGLRFDAALPTGK